MSFYERFTAATLPAALPACEQVALDLVIVLDYLIIVDHLMLQVFLSHWVGPFSGKMSSTIPSSRSFWSSLCCTLTCRRDSPQRRMGLSLGKELALLSEVGPIVLLLVLLIATFPLEARPDVLAGHCGVG